MLELLNSYSSLIQLVFIVVLIPVFRYMKRQNDRVICLESMANNLEESNRILREEVEMLRTILFGTLSSEDLQKYIAELSRIRIVHESHNG